MAPTIPEIEPAEITAGDTVAWSKSLDDYPAGEYTLHYVLAGGGAKIEITAETSGTDHLVSVSAATTAEWAAGDYAWFSYATKDDERYTIDSGTITVKADPTGYAATVDLRSHVKIVLDAIEAVLEGRATKDQEEYTVGGDSLKRTPIAALLQLRSFYKAEYEREKTAEALAKGSGVGGRILTRFV